MIGVLRWLGWAVVWIAAVGAALFGLFWIIADWQAISERMSGVWGAAFLTTALIGFWLHELEKRLDRIADQQREILDRLPRNYRD